MLDFISDFWDFMRERKKWSALGHFGMKLFVNSSFFRLVYRIYDHNFNKEIKIRSQHDWNEMAKMDGSYKQEWNSVRTYLIKIRSLADQIGAKMIVIYIPQDLEWTNGLVRSIPDQMTAWSKEDGYLLLNTMPNFETVAIRSNKPLHYKKDGHCTVEGQHVIAEALYSFIYQNQVFETKN